MIDVGRSHRLALESRDDLGYPGQFAVQDLDGQALAHQHVLGRVDTPHAAGPEQAIQAVAFCQNRPDARIALFRARVPFLGFVSHALR